MEKSVQKDGPENRGRLHWYVTVEWCNCLHTWFYALRSQSNELLSEQTDLKYGVYGMWDTVK